MKTKVLEEILKEFDELYPLQIWTEDNQDQAIVISPTLQKSHKELLKDFIEKSLTKHTEEVIGEIERMNLWSKGTAEGTRQDIIAKLKHFHNLK